MTRTDPSREAVRQAEWIPCALTGRAIFRALAYAIRGSRAPRLRAALSGAFTSNVGVGTYILRITHLRGMQIELSGVGGDAPRMQGNRPTDGPADCARVRGIAGVLACILVSVVLAASLFPSSCPSITAHHLTSAPLTERQMQSILSSKFRIDMLIGCAAGRATHGRMMRLRCVRTFVLDVIHSGSCQTSGMDAIGDENCVDASDGQFYA